MKYIVVVLFAIISLLLSASANADVITFEKEYIYQASEFDSKVSSRILALEQVKRALLEQLGTYLISETEVKNYQMTKDQMTTLTAGIVSAEIIDEKWDGKTYYLKAKIAADPKEVLKSVEVLRNDKQKSKELDESRKKAEEAMKEVERLKKELKLVKGNTKKQGDYNTAINVLSATDWLVKGYKLFHAGNLQGAIEAYSKAIELNPNYTDAYVNRGVANDNSGNTQQAIKDYNNAIELNPQDAMTYNARGLVYYNSGNTQQAIKDYNKAIELNPQDATVYHNRGDAYLKSGIYH